MAARFNKKTAAAHGYTRADWDAGSDNPTLTATEIKNPRPAKEVLPAAFFEEIDKARKARGRPALDNPKKVVSIRLDPDVIDKFKATGKGWQSLINAILKDAKV